MRKKKQRQRTRCPWWRCATALRSCSIDFTTCISPYLKITSNYVLQRCARVTTSTLTKNKNQKPKTTNHFVRTRLLQCSSLHHRQAVSVAQKMFEIIQLQSQRCYVVTSTVSYWGSAAVARFERFDFGFADRPAPAHTPDTIYQRRAIRLSSVVTGSYSTKTSQSNVREQKQSVQITAVVDFCSARSRRHQLHRRRHTEIQQREFNNASIYIIRCSLASFRKARRCSRSTRRRRRGSP